MFHKYFILTLVLFAFFNAVDAQTNNSKIHLILRVDDYGIDNAFFYDKLINLINKNNCALTIGVVPFKKVKECYNPIPDSLVKKLMYYCKSNVNIEIAQHGYCHENNMSFSGTSEFISLGQNLQLAKINMGKKLLESQLHTNISTFIPPWNNFDANTTKALYSAGFNGISASTYGLFGIKDIDKRLKYVPYTISLTRLIGNNNLIKDLICLPNNSIVVILFHGFDFDENQPTISTKENHRYISDRKINLVDFDDFIHALNDKKIFDFCTFKQLYLNNNVDLSSDRYLHAAIDEFTILFWPQISLESLSYQKINKMNWKNIYFNSWPIIFYTIIILAGYLISLLVFRRPTKELKTVVFFGFVFFMGLGLGLLFIKISLKFFVLGFLWFGSLIGYFRFAIRFFLNRE